MSLSGKFLCVPSASDTVVTTTFGNTDTIDHLSLGENGVNWDVLLEVILAPVDFLGDRATVDLDFHDVSFFLTEGKSFHLSVADGTNGNGVFLNCIILGRS